jgi:hypothetical protein
VRWYTPTIPSFRRLRQEDHKFEAAWAKGKTMSQQQQEEENKNNKIPKI